MYNVDAARNYVAMYDEYVANVVVVIHIGSGMPARASELETHRTRNSLNCARSTYFLGKNIFFHPQYSKTRSTSGHSLVICRFLDEEASLLLLTDLFIVRPFVASLTHFLEINNGNPHYNELLFVRQGVSLKQDLTNIFCTKFSDYTGVNIYFQDFRHIAKYYALKIGLNLPSMENICLCRLNVVN